MSFILRPFMYLALVGFVASLIAHLCGYVGIDKPFGISPWPLHVGIFIVWFPAVLVFHNLSKDFPQRDMWKAALRGCPNWMRTLLYVIGGYAFLSFFAFMAIDSFSSSEASTIRGFSGHWLIFYYAAFVILYSAINVSQQDSIRRCSNGHPMKPNDKFCSQCGMHVGSMLDSESAN